MNRLPLGAALLGAALLGTAAAPSGPAREIDLAVRLLLASRAGLDFGVLVEVPGEGTVYARGVHRVRPAASAIKAFIALDLVRNRPLDAVPAGTDSLLQPGVHPAFSGFSPQELERARTALAGADYRTLARIMMGHSDYGNDVYNAACNLVMVDLGGPEAIRRRVEVLHPAFTEVDLNRYMFDWHRDGDNGASPAALAALYRAVAAGRLHDLDGVRMAEFRELLRVSGDGGLGTRYEKPGTLYPDPMVRVRAGYIERGARDLVFAVMGEQRADLGLPPEDAFVGLLAAVDTLTAICTEVP